MAGAPGRGKKRTRSGSHVPRPPAGLTVDRFQREGEEFAVFSWPLQQRRENPALPPALGDVLECVLAGMSNAQIAARRGTSPRTVANQIAALLRLHGVRSRVELARLAGPMGRR